MALSLLALNAPCPHHCMCPDSTLVVHISCVQSSALRPVPDGNSLTNQNTALGCRTKTKQFTSRCHKTPFCISTGIAKNQLAYQQKSQLRQKVWFYVQGIIRVKSCDSHLEARNSFRKSTRNSYVLSILRIKHKFTVIVQDIWQSCSISRNTLWCLSYFNLSNILVQFYVNLVMAFFCFLSSYKKISFLYYTMCADLFPGHVLACSRNIFTCMTIKPWICKSSTDIRGFFSA